MSANGGPCLVTQTKSKLALDRLASNSKKHRLQIRVTTLLENRRVYTTVFGFLTTGLCRYNHPGVPVMTI